MFRFLIVDINTLLATRQVRHGPARQHLVSVLGQLTYLVLRQQLRPTFLQTRARLAEWLDSINP